MIYKFLAFLAAATGKNAVQQNPILLDLVLLIRQLRYAFKRRHCVGNVSDVELMS